MTIRNWGPEQLVDTATSASDSVHNPDIVALPDGGFVIVWEDLSGVTFTTFSAIHMQRYDAYGNKLGDEMLFRDRCGSGREISSRHRIAEHRRFRHGVREGGRRI